MWGKVNISPFPSAFIQLKSDEKEQITIYAVRLSNKNYSILSSVLSLNSWYILKRFRSFHTGNIGFVGQRAAKLLVIKVGGLKKKSATLAITAKVCASTNHSQSLMDGNFAAFWPTNPIFPFLKHLNPFKTVSKV